MLDIVIAQCLRHAVAPQMVQVLFRCCECRQEPGPIRLGATLAASLGELQAEDRLLCLRSLALLAPPDLMQHGVVELVPTRKDHEYVLQLQLDEQQFTPPVADMLGSPLSGASPLEVGVALAENLEDHWQEVAQREQVMRDQIVEHDIEGFKLLHHTYPSNVNRAVFQIGDVQYGYGEFPGCIAIDIVATSSLNIQYVLSAETDVRSPLEYHVTVEVEKQEFTLVHARPDDAETRILGRSDIDWEQVKDSCLETEKIYEALQREVKALASKGIQASGQFVASVGSAESDVASISISCRGADGRIGVREYLLYPDARGAVLKE